MIYFWLIVLGLCFGSFVNALVWRIYQQSLPKRKRAAKDAELSIVHGRSMCPNCKHTLAWYDLLPVISWMTLRGKCRYCNKSVSVQYPMVELASALLFVTSYLLWPLELAGLLEQVQFGMWLVALIVMTALFVYDVKWMLLPNRLTAILAGISAVYAVLALAMSSVTLGNVLSLCGAVLVTAGLFYLLFQVSEGRWIGGGDVKLAVSLGLLIGSVELGFLLLLAASLLGILFAVPSLIGGKAGMTSKLPFGPFLITATVITVLFGDAVVNWYVNTLLFV